MGIFNVAANGGRAGSNIKSPMAKNCGTAAAGTVYFHSMDLMFISNFKEMTEKYTRMSATEKKSVDFPNEYMLSKYLKIADGANVNIKNRGIRSILFPTLEMYDDTSLRFEMTDVDDFELKYREHF